MRLINPLRNLLSASLLSLAGLTAQADQVTFQVDMSSMTNSAGLPAYTEVRASGAFNGWSQSGILTNNGANIFTNTFEVPANGNYKYTCAINGGTEWEAGGDHGITLTGSPQTLPLLTFNYGGAVPIDFVTNNITFKVDMTVQGVSFINGGGVVTVSGGFNGWGNSMTLTNDSGAGFPTNWWYSGTFPAVTQLIPPSWPNNAAKYNRFKFRANGGWEEPGFNPIYNSNDRSWDATTTGDKVLPLVFYSDASLCDVLAEDTAVTFSIRVTNGTVALDGHVFDNSVDTIHINGESLLGTWQPWNFLLPTLFRDGSSDYYTNTFVIPAGRPRNQKVKYNMVDGNTLIGGDNEAPQFADHVQWIRTTNNTYTMAPVEFGTNYAAIRVQKQYGDLAIGAASGGNVPVTWLGCPCVTLQSRTNLTSGSWTDLPATESASATNVPATVGQQYFRLQKRFTP